ncbi:MAG: hypothetical protein FJ221_05830 [Lentisphaerae bacterium]|nr:hypothetical protein [Lentisphaerota bacterium]
MYVHVLGLISGDVSGILRPKGRVMRRERKVGAMPLRGFTIQRFMMSANLSGLAGLRILRGA